MQIIINMQISRWILYRKVRFDYSESFHFYSGQSKIYCEYGSLSPYLGILIYRRSDLFTE